MSFNKIEERYENEETLRTKIYGILDCMSRPASPMERKLWTNLHNSICNLGKYYRSKGFDVWEH